MKVKRLKIIIFFSLLCSILFGEENSARGPEEKVTLKPDEISDWEARLELARVLSYTKRYDESLKEYQKLLESKPNSVIARREMAAVLFYAGKEEEAEHEILLIPEKDRDDQTWLVLADIYVKEKKYLGAKEILNHYLNNHPNDDNARLKLALLFSWNKDYQESTRQFEIILHHRPDDIQVRRLYARVLTWMGNQEAAIEEWKKTL